ncbi:Uncharacterised protein [Brucella anthropi]|nr:Uncharacterised protein [Brucella anthropi]
MWIAVVNNLPTLILGTFWSIGLFAAGWFLGARFARWRINRETKSRG